ncbi:MAG: hypothetical protein KME18_16160 [Phormidium tanganyikae FI6-MK23]|jgi:hypothetical protein|nr:hypothetical protein [Phormidium tanganyikae FI6-MK23]
MNKSTTNGNGTSNGNSTSQTILPSFSSDASSSTSAEHLSQSDRDNILNLITQINDFLPFLRDLSAEERKSMLGMGNKNRIFAGKVLEVIQQKSDFLPRSFDTEKFQQDLATFDRLSTILMALNQLRDLVDATTIAIGTEAYENALTAYRHAKASGQGASLESMMAEMAQRFARKPKQKDDEKPEIKE